MHDRADGDGSPPLDALIPVDPPRQGNLRDVGVRTVPNDPGDGSIGATGVVHEEPVLTANVDHFERIPGLEAGTC